MSSERVIEKFLKTVNKDFKIYMHIFLYVKYIPMYLNTEMCIYIHTTHFQILVCGLAVSRSNFSLGSLKASTLTMHMVIFFSSILGKRGK